MTCIVCKTVAEKREGLTPYEKDIVHAIHRARGDSLDTGMAIEGVAMFFHLSVYYCNRPETDELHIAQSPCTHEPECKEKEMSIHSQAFGDESNRQTYEQQRDAWFAGQRIVNSNVYQCEKCLSCPLMDKTISPVGFIEWKDRHFTGRCVTGRCAEQPAPKCNDCSQRGFIVTSNGHILQCPVHGKARCDCGHLWPDNHSITDGCRVAGCECRVGVLEATLIPSLTPVIGSLVGNRPKASDVELQLLFVVMGEKDTIIKLESKSPISLGKWTCIQPLKILHTTMAFAEIRALVDALADGEKPVPCPSVRKNAEGCFVIRYEDAAYLPQEIIINNCAFDALIDIAGEALPLWKPRVGTWTQLYPVTLDPNLLSCAPITPMMINQARDEFNDLLPLQIWRYQLKST